MSSQSSSPLPSPAEIENLGVLFVGFVAATILYGLTFFRASRLQAPAYFPEQIQLMVRTSRNLQLLLTVSERSPMDKIPCQFSFPLSLLRFRELNFFAKRLHCSGELDHSMRQAPLVTQSSTLDTVASAISKRPAT
jgi:hypothetical protein